MDVNISTAPSFNLFLKYDVALAYISAAEDDFISSLIEKLTASVVAFSWASSDVENPNL